MVTFCIDAIGAYVADTAGTPDCVVLIAFDSGLRVTTLTWNGIAPDVFHMSCGCELSGLILLVTTVDRSTLRLPSPSDSALVCMLRNILEIIWLTGARSGEIDDHLIAIRPAGTRKRTGKVSICTLVFQKLLTTMPKWAGEVCMINVRCIPVCD